MKKKNKNFEPEQQVFSEQFMEDAREIESICSVYDLSDPVSNKRLYEHLKKEKKFSTWIGRGFLLGLENRTKSEAYHRTVRRVSRMVLCSFLLLIGLLTVGMTYFKIQDEKEDAVLSYIRQERNQARKAALLQNSLESDEKAEESEASYEDVIQVELQAEREEETEEEKDSEIESVSTDTEPSVLSEYVVMHSMYPDIIGWIQIDGTDIDYPVLQKKEDEDFYLNHNFQGESDSKGSLFVDGRTEIWPLDQNLVIFGHNMSNGAMLGTLDYYLDASFYEAHQTIVFDTIYSKNLYEIVAVVKTVVKQEEEDGFRYYWLHNYSSRQEYEELLSFIEENQIYDTGKKLDYQDQTIMLSTCEYSVDNGRLVVIAKKL